MTVLLRKLQKPEEELYAEYGHVDYGMSLYEFDGHVNIWEYYIKGNMCRVMDLMYGQYDDRAKEFAEIRCADYFASSKDTKFVEIKCADHFASLKGAKYQYYSMKGYCAAKHAGLLKYYCDLPDDDDRDDYDNSYDEDSGDEDYQSDDESIKDNQSGNHDKNVEDIRKLNEKLRNLLSDLANKKFDETKKREEQAAVGGHLLRNALGNTPQNSDMAKKIYGIGKKEAIDNQSDNNQPAGDDQFEHKQNGIDKSAGGQLLENEQSGNEHSDNTEPSERQINKKQPLNEDDDQIDPINDQSCNNQSKPKIKLEEEFYAEYGHVDYGMSLYKFKCQVNEWELYIKNNYYAYILSWFNRYDERAKEFAEIRCADFFASSEGAKKEYFSMKAYHSAENAGLLKYYYASYYDNDARDDDDTDDNNNDDYSDDDDDDDYQFANGSIDDNQCGNYNKNVEDIRKLNEKLRTFLSYMLAKKLEEIGEEQAFDGHFGNNQLSNDYGNTQSTKEARKIDGIGEKEAIDNQSDNNQPGDDQFGNKPKGIDKCVGCQFWEWENEDSDNNEPAGGDSQINNNPLLNDDHAGGDEYVGNYQSGNKQLDPQNIGTNQLAIVAKKIDEKSKDISFRRLLYILKQILTPPKNFGKRFILFIIGSVETAGGIWLSIRFTGFVAAHGIWLIHQGIHDIVKSIVSDANDLTVKKWVRYKLESYAFHMAAEGVHLLATPSIRHQVLLFIRENLP